MIQDDSVRALDLCGGRVTWRIESLYLYVYIYIYLHFFGGFRSICQVTLKDFVVVKKRSFLRGIHESTKAASYPFRDLVIGSKMPRFISPPLKSSETD